MTSMEIYNSSSEHSSEDIQMVKLSATKEQERRMADAEGENHRRIIAHNTSDLFNANTRSTWFQQGSALVFQLLNLAGDKAFQLSSTISNIAGEKGRDTANGLKNKLDTLGNKGQAVAADVAKDVIAKAEVASNKGKETASELKQKVQAKGAEAVSDVQQTIKTKLQEGLGKVQGAALLVKESSLSLLDRVSLAFSQNSNLAFLLLEEEAERAYRMNSETQVYAILNALNVSRLIKDIGYEFYRPLSEPTRAYSTRLLENLEQSRRMAQDITDKTNVNNAKAVAELLQHKFRSSTTPSPVSVMAKKEVVAEIDKQGNRILSAAM